MKIILQDQGVMDEDVKKSIEKDALVSPEFALDDSAFDVPGWISVEVGGVSVAEVHINDLYPAAIAYKERFEQAN